MSRWARQTYNKKSQHAKISKRFNQYNQHVNISNEHNNQIHIIDKHNIRTLDVLSTLKYTKVQKGGIHWLTNQILYFS